MPTCVDQIASDTEYAEVVRDSRRKRREAHPDYQKTYRQAHAAAIERILSSIRWR